MMKFSNVSFIIPIIFHSILHFLMKNSFDETVVDILGINTFIMVVGKLYSRTYIGYIIVPILLVRKLKKYWDTVKGMIDIMQAANSGNKRNK